MSMFLENVLLDGTDPDSIAFQVKILEKSGFSEKFGNFEDIAREGSNTLFTKSYLSSRRTVHLFSQRKKKISREKSDGLW